MDVPVPLDRGRRGHDHSHGAHLGAEVRRGRVRFPQIQEQIMEVARVIPQRRIPERIVEHARDVPVPQTREQTVGVVKYIHQERISETYCRTNCRCCQRLRFWKRSLRQFRPHMNECNNEPSSMWPQTKTAPGSEFQKEFLNRSSTPPIPHQPGDQVRRDFADTVHRQGYYRASCDTATGPSASNFCENSGSTADAVRRQRCGPGITTRRLEADVSSLLRRLGTR